MNVLVLNGGSSSIKFSVFDVAEDEHDPRLILDGELSGMGKPHLTLAVTRSKEHEEKRTVEGSGTPAGAIGVVLNAVAGSTDIRMDAVGYRVVHPGPRIKDHVEITGDVLKELEAAAEFAPLHDPNAVAMIREAMKRMPEIPHFACFDTVFHETMPEEASTYPIPAKYRERGVKRYGFHGLSCESAVRQMRTLGAVPSRIVIAHLGSGCSVTALLDGRSVDTTMGLTPTGGVVMGTRPGDMDPGLLIYLFRQEKAGDGVDKLEQMLNHDAGLVAMTGLTNDMVAVRAAAADGNDAAVLALKVFTRSVQKAIGGFAWLLGGLDAIVFTGGIGEHDAASRVAILSGSEARIDEALNEAQSADVRRVSASNAKTTVFVIAAQEDLVIALHVRRMVRMIASTTTTNVPRPSA